MKTPYAGEGEMGTSLWQHAGTHSASPSSEGAVRTLRSEAWTRISQLHHIRSKKSREPPLERLNRLRYTRHSLQLLLGTSE